MKRPGCCDGKRIPEMLSLSVLLIEDNQDHAALVSRSLTVADHEIDVEITHRCTLTEAIETIQKQAFDVVVSDLRLPDSSLEKTLPAVLNAAGKCPVVVLTSLNDSAFGAELIKQGAQDFLVKSSITGPLITRSILYAIERRRHQLQQLDHAEQLESLVETRTRHLQLLRSVADVSHEAQSIRDALQQTVNHVCEFLEMPLGTACLLPQPLASAAQEIGVLCQKDDRVADMLRVPAERNRLLQKAIDEQHVMTTESNGTFEIVVPIVSGKSVPAVLEFRADTTPVDTQSVLAVMERIRTQVGRVFERDELQRAIEESAHLEQQTLIGELHDGLGHELSGLTWLAHSHMLKLSESNSEESNTAAELHTGLRNSLGMLRETLRGLTSLQLGAGGFIPALASLVAETDRRSDCRFEFDCDVTVAPLPEFVAAQTYRIVQESLTNISKHAHAEKACVTVMYRENQLIISVADDGVGLPNRDNVDSGLGFGIMRHRARIIGGEFTIRDAPAGGLQLVLTVPVHPSPSSSK